MAEKKTKSKSPRSGFAAPAIGRKWEPGKDGPHAYLPNGEVNPARAKWEKRTKRKKGKK